MKKYLITALLVTVGPLTAFAADVSALSQAKTTVNPNDRGFRLVICDGPEQLNQMQNGLINTNVQNDPNFIPCDFNGIMLEVRHLIDIAMVAAVLAAIIGFTYAGILYMTGNEDKIKQAKRIFPKIFWGFIIILTAWFIVYQILTWITSNPNFTTLLGK